MVKIKVSALIQMDNSKNQKEISKGEKFTNKIPTEIWLEEPSQENEFIVEKQYLYGYDFEELVSKLSYPQMLYLTLTGEIPSAKQAAILNLLLKLFITPGIRHPATRAAMNAGIGRTHVTHILPISLSVLSSEYLGSVEVGASMKWLKRNIGRQPNITIAEIESQIQPQKPNPIPGFGTIYGSVDSYALKLLQQVKQLEFEFPFIDEIKNLLDGLNQQGLEISWLPSGVAAALFLEINLSHRTGVALYQIMQSPGLAAHGIEKANKPLTDMPFTPESDYEITSNT